jgi:hypothetical protein
LADLSKASPAASSMVSPSRVAADAVDPHQLGVAAGDQQCDEGKFRRVGAQEGRQQVAFEVVHAQHRLAQRRAQRAGHARAHQQRAGQAGAPGVGDHVDIAQRSRPRPAPVRQRQHAADVVAAGQFRHHAAVGLVHGDLAVQRVRASSAARRAPCGSTSATPVSSQDDSIPNTSMKELAGQERACGAAAFASGRNESARQQQWLHLIESQERCFQVFSEFSGPELEAQWLAHLPPAQTAELERLRRIACAAPAGVALDPNLSPAWFDCCTRRIDAMQTVEARLAADLHQLCIAKISRARGELQTHESLLAQIAHAPPASPAAFFDQPATPLLAASPAAGGPPYGRQLERSILDMVQEQSLRLQAMSDELDTVRASLNERKLVERAKGLLMAHRRLSEAEAHKMLRQTAMNQNRRLIDVAESVLSMAEYLPVDGKP